MPPSSASTISRDLLSAATRNPRGLPARYAHGGVVVQRVALVEHAERQSAALGDSPGIRLLSAFEQVQQRGFAVAVAVDDADAIALEYALRHIGEDGFGGEGE